MAKAIFAFSADPITYGHIDLIKRAADMFELIIVGVGTNPDKQYTFSYDERLQMTKECLKSIPNVEIKHYHGLTIDFALQNNANVIVRGVRNATDVAYEITYARMNLSQKTNLQTVFIPADPKLMHVSSNVVKSIEKDNGLITEYVPYCVKQKMEEKMAHQYYFSITGGIASGKSTISRQLVQIARKNGIESHFMELDKIGHKVLSSGSDPYYNQIKDEICKELCYWESLCIFTNIVYRLK